MTFLTSLFVGVFLLSTVIEAGVEDSITISVDDTDFSASKTEVKNMLDKADLERHGYEREEVTKLTTDSSGRKFYSKALFYFKAVKCSEATQTIQELKNLLSGIMTPALVTKLQADLKAQDTTGAGRECKIGLKTASNDATPEIARTKRGALRRPKRWLGSVRARVEVDVRISCCRGRK